MNAAYVGLILLVASSPGHCGIEDEISHLLSTMTTLAKQTMMQQQVVAERLRASGSGFRVIRQTSGGTRPYLTDSTTTSTAYLAIHGHYNHIRTIGMGEVQVVMNGIEFRTHHNDFSVTQPHPQSSAFQAIQPIAFPEVPLEVTARANAEDQIAEMREWFRAFKMQDHSRRDYRKYFKPILCYMEAYWIHPYSLSDDPFRSDRHSNAAGDWKELHDKSLFYSYSGLKADSEDIAYLPMSVMDIVNDTYPVIGQWTYRPMCHPLKEDLPLSNLHLFDDISARMKRELTLDEYADTRLARFQVKTPESVNAAKQSEPYDLMDKLMSEVPGLNNYVGDLKNDLLGTYMPYASKEKKSSKLNAAFYHRWYTTDKKDRMGTKINRYGFNDPNIFMAMNNQSGVADIPLAYKCEKDSTGARKCKYTRRQKWSYALPLEIVYLTPLSRWNPYDIIYRGDERTHMGMMVMRDGRNGSLSRKYAYNGTNSMKYYMTPSSFFSNPKAKDDPADTGDRQETGVLNKTGHVVKVAGSGIRIITNVTDVGNVRFRFPISRICKDGNKVWQELDALKQLVLNSDSYQNIFSGSSTLRRTVLTLTVTLSENSNITRHTHEVRLTADDVRHLATPGNTRMLYTSYAAGHFHALKLKYDNGQYHYVKCDEKPEETPCGDQHDFLLVTDKGDIRK